MTLRVLITGGAGALGRVLLERLRQSPARFEARAPARSGGSDALDVTDADRLADVLRDFRPDWVFHLAATLSEDFEAAFKVNVLAARCILETVRDSGLKTRVILIGSAAEYGLLSPAENPVSEHRVLRPVSVYGATKAWQTSLAYKYAACGVDVLVARVFNLLGPGLSERLFIGRLRRQIHEVLCGERDRIEVGPLSATRDYVLIEEAVTQLLLIAARGAAGEVYHVASGQPVSMRRLLKSELAAHGLDAAIVDEGPSAALGRCYGAAAIFADIRKTLDLAESGSGPTAKAGGGEL